MTKDNLNKLYWLLDNLKSELPEEGFEKEWMDIEEVKAFVECLEEEAKQHEKKIKTYHRWGIYQDTEKLADGINKPIYRCYTPEEMEQPAGLRYSEWDACSLEEALQFIRNY